MWPPLSFLLMLFLVLWTSKCHTDSAPKFEWQPPEFLELPEEQNIDLQCPARARPQPIIRWSFNAIPFHQLADNGRRILLDQGRLLRIVQLKRDLDNGLYECNATNSVGYLTSATFLNVQAFAPHFGHSSQRVWKVLRNAQVDMNCDVDAAPKPEVHWVDANDTEIPTIPGKLEFIANHTLRFYSVSSADDGFYYCNVSNRYGLNRAMNRLEVFNPTFFSEVPSPSNLTINAFDTVALRCHAVADPRLAIDYVWTINGRPVGEQPMMNEDGSSTFVIKEARGRHSGKIECAAVTDVDVKMATMELLVKDVPEAPELLRIDCSSRHHAFLVWRRPKEHGSPLTAFTVEASAERGNGRNGQQWEKVSEEQLEEEGNVRKDLHKTTIPLLPNVNYTFRLFAHNEYGASEPAMGPANNSSQCSTPEDVPFQNPKGVIVAGNEPDNLVIRWEPMPRERWNAPGLRYLIRYRRVEYNGEVNGEAEENYNRNEREWTEFYVEDPFANFTVIREQPTFRPYQVQVRAVNSKGFSTGEPDVQQGFSGEDVPLESPKNLRMMAQHNFSSVTIEWEQVPESSVRGHFRGYRVDYWQSTRPLFTSSMFTPNTSNSQTISGLQALHNYTAKVHVVNGQYESNPSNWLQFRTGEGVPSKVHNLRVISVGSNSILVTWEPPLYPNGNLRGYFLAFKNGSSGLIEETYVLYRQQFYLHEQLSSNTPFRVAVWAETGGGEGPRIWRHTKTWPLRDPDPPLFSVRPSPTSASTLRIHWLPSGNGTTWRMTGTSFAVNFSMQSEPNKWLLSEWITLPQTMMELKELREGTDYLLMGIAREGKRQTESKQMEIRTESARSTPPFSQERLRSAAWFLAVLITSALVLALAGVMCILAQRSTGATAGKIATIRLREKRFSSAFRVDMDSQEEDSIGGSMNSSTEWITSIDVESNGGADSGPRQFLLAEKRKKKSLMAQEQANKISNKMPFKEDHKEEKQEVGGEIMDTR